MTTVSTPINATQLAALRAAVQFEADNGMGTTIDADDSDCQRLLNAGYVIPVRGGGGAYQLTDAGRARASQPADTATGGIVEDPMLFEPWSPNAR